MVKQIKENEKILYKCEACGFRYEDQEFAQKCEDWCRKNNSCNLEITKHAIENK